MGSHLITGDERLDPRIRAVFSTFDPPPLGGAVDAPLDRDGLLALANAPEALAARARMVALLDRIDTDVVAPGHGLSITDHQVTSQPDGNTINLRVVRPDDDQRRPVVYYIHGGGMTTQSCYDGNYRVWAKILAANGVVVAMVDFRNALQPSSVPEVAPYPAGLNDCASGLDWVLENAATLGVDRDRVVVSGESGGGNLTLALAMRLQHAGRGDTIGALYVLCPYIGGNYPDPAYPSTTENEGILLTLHGNHGRIAYGIEAYEARDPLAWPGFAREDDVRGLPPTVIRVNEADPLRDEGIAFYRLLQRAGVAARCDLSVGTIHAVEVMPAVCPDITAAVTADIARVARSVAG